MVANEPRPITKDAKIDVRVPKITRIQAIELANAKNLRLSTYVQLLIEDEHNKTFS